MFLFYKISGYEGLGVSASEIPQRMNAILKLKLLILLWKKMGLLLNEIKLNCVHLGKFIELVYSFLFVCFCFELSQTLSCDFQNFSCYHCHFWLYHRSLQKCQLTDSFAVVLKRQ